MSKITLCLILFSLMTACNEQGLQVLDDEAMILEAHQGQWVFINYWAVWCKPCIEEIPELNHFSQDARVAVYGFNYDRLDDANLRLKVEQFGLAYPSLLEDPAVLFNQPAPQALPATLVLNPQGEVARWLFGPQTVSSLTSAIE